MLSVIDIRQIIKSKKPKNDAFTKDFDFILVSNQTPLSLFTIPQNDKLEYVF